MTVQEPRKKISTNTFSPYSIAMQLPPPPKLPKGAHERMICRIKQPLLPITQKSKQLEENLLKTLSNRSNSKKKLYFDSLPVQMRPKVLFTEF
jgi:hypothetical protein